jgi:DNA helicase MCM8
VPTNCESGDRCRSKTFYPLRDKAITVDWQKIRLQEIFDTPAPNIGMTNSAEVGASLGTQGTTQSDAGRVPRTIEVELTEDLVDSVTPGDVISLAGVVKVTTTEARAGKCWACVIRVVCLTPWIRSAQCETKQGHVSVLH